MRKVYRTFLLLIVSALFLFITGCSNEEPEHVLQPDQQQHQNEQIQSLLISAREAAEKGRLSDGRWQAGMTTYQQVIDELGEPDKIERTGNGNYAIYEKARLELGLTENHLIYEMRSSDSEWETITEDVAEEVLGAPDKYLESDEQKIAVYDLNDKYELNVRFTAAESAAATAKQIAVVHKQSAEIQSVIQKMGTDEKLGQLIMMGVQGPRLDSAAKKFIEETHVGGVILFKRNLVSVTQSLTLLNELKQANADAKAPLFISADEEGGRVTRLPKEIMKSPSNRKIGNAESGKYAFEAGELAGRKMSAFGLNMDFAPVLDVDSNPSNPVIGDRSYSSDAKLVSKAGIRQAKGMKSQRVIPVVKHFPGHGDTSVDSHIELPVIRHTKERLQNVELLPFKEAIQEGINAVMVGHLIVQAYDPKTPASFSKPVIQGLLRDELQFNGVVITDDLIMGAIGKNYSIGDAAIQSILAGGDILLVGHDYQPVTDVLTALHNALDEGTITEQRINQSVERILLVKQQYEVDDLPHEKVDVEELNRLTKELLNKLQ
ncbi:beta-N-acetylhexosaminidase [Sporosarcina sp. P33]|uniref:beta-N-acetylhexosaminidase n=1 Tax=Sporosarcina sp. P33 TaxID=1930764 RepID=UPI0009C2566F|nr:beta-N-acetylhexosaminidase [Sporosarcina sp. P33]ARD47778.1 hypothetical protein SporoP33_05770 [Sporosarcina sp. P33]